MLQENSNYRLNNATTTVLIFLVTIAYLIG